MITQWVNQFTMAPSTAQHSCTPVLLSAVRADARQSVPAIITKDENNCHAARSAARL